MSRITVKYISAVILFALFAAPVSAFSDASLFDIADYKIFAGTKFYTSETAVIREKVFGYIPDTSGKTIIACPDKSLNILAFGQSNSANSILDPEMMSTDGHLANYYDGKCYLLEDPPLAATGNGGSIWTLLAHSIYEKYRVPVTVLSHGVGGASISEWHPESTGRPYMRNMIENAQLYPGVIHYVIFHQGETDAARYTSYEEYGHALEVIFDYVQEQLDGDQVFLIYGVSKCVQTPDGWPPVVKAQNDLAERRKDTLFVYETDILDDLFRYDGCHFNVSGAQEIVDKTIKFINTSVVKLSEKQ